ncbi:NAC transcription factor NAM-B2 [Hibiscus syriacus]|uniref:NAC transcription factor NAM-B2 n=1 Tax=Hibiscus syriacus TaxID=106335 RepID=A0A6A2XA16_HIBSY|nr:NAC domain-containing protein 96-like [Hibiscus syriacus]KAE8671938.1 NAC transcription factor NAM-B2 [Hibiscus syriacus]
MERDFVKSLPPGYKFKPTDEQLVDFYLKRKAYNIPLPPVNLFREVDLYKYDPYTLTEMSDNASSWNGITTEWYFFSPRDRKYPKGSRPRRRAGDGYWKATGKPTPVISSDVEVGSKRSLVYCRGKSPNGEKTDWIMHEYVLAQAPPRQRLNDQDMQLDWVLCRVYKRREPRSKSGTPVEGCNNKEQEENGISSDALNTVMPRQTISVPFSNQYNDYVFPRYTESFGAGTMPAPLASMPPYHQFQPKVLPSHQFSGAGPINLNFTTPYEFIVDVQQEDVDNGAVNVAQNKGQVLKNGSFVLQQNSESFGVGTMPAPLVSMPLYHHFQPEVPPLQHFSRVGPSNLNFTVSDGPILDVQQEDFDNGAVNVSQNEGQVLENGSVVLPQYSESLGVGTMPLYHQFQQQVPPSQHFSGAGPINLNFTASDGFILDVQQEEVDNGAIVAKSEAGVMENGPDALNTLISFPGQFDDYLLPGYPEYFDSI